MAYVEKLPSGKWRGVYRDPIGRKRSRTFPFKDGAEKWSEDMEHDIRHGHYKDPTLRALTVRQWSVMWTAGRVVEDTTAAGDRHRMAGILEAWGDEPLDMLTTVALQGWVSRMVKAGRAPATVRKYHGLLSTMLTAAVRERLITENPCAFVQLPAVPPSHERFLTAEEFEAVIEHLPPPYDLTTYVAAFTGLRWGELAGLHVKSLDLLRGSIIVAETLTQVEGQGMRMKAYPKGKKPRRVPIPDHVGQALAAYLAANPPRPCDLGHKGCTGLVFRNSAGSPLSRHNNRKAILVAAGKAGVDAFRPHDLRHTAASWLAEDGVPLFDVQHFLGHGSITTTQRYAHLAPTSGDRVRSALNRKIMGQKWGKSANEGL